MYLNLIILLNILLYTTNGNPYIYDYNSNISQIPVNAVGNTHTRQYCTRVHHALTEGQRLTDSYRRYGILLLLLAVDSPPSNFDRRRLAPPGTHFQSLRKDMFFSLSFFITLATAISKSLWVTCTRRSRSANMPASVHTDLISAPVLLGHNLAKSSYLNVCCGEQTLSSVTFIIIFTKYDCFCR